MKGDWYMIATTLVAIFVVVAGEDKPITPIPTECPDEDSPDFTVQIAHESDCTKFYTCLGGMKFEKDCPVMNKKGKRLHFNALLQVCDWPAKAGCTTGGNTVPTEKPTQKPPTKPTKKPTKKPTQKPTPTPPTKPTKKPTQKPTPTPVTKPKTKPTPAPVTKPTVVTPDETTEPESLCPEVDAELITYPHPCSCEKYYSCRQGDLVLRKCPNGQHWNAKKQKCESPSKAQCIKNKTTKWYYDL
ncbi:hypothetical protein KPH14_004587 [Odynerus spinipes]|uniref:Chitin-binding type-2 domain-containing protein n=1 Tax=Odynerus spinipes TaxID=1348599 RepID=A0AAD9VPF8_9HYME|nr:hypothetical protein KPH14_004587 [Odynerus spinipes]